MFSRATSRSKRRARKSSPDPEPRSSPYPAASSPDQLESGRRRRRAVDVDSFPHDNVMVAAGDDDDDEEPSSSRQSQDRPRRPPSQLPTFQAGNTCNNFLLGGQFYPGKDKKRRHHQMRARRTLWYRIFCSSPVRMGASVLFVSYVLVWHVVVPTTQVLLEYGTILSGGRYSHFMDSASSFPLLLSIKQERKQAMRLQTERDRLQYGDAKRHQLRLSIWEDVVPDWLHRNDEKIAEKKTKSAAKQSGKPVEAEVDKAPGRLSRESEDESGSLSRQSGDQGGKIKSSDRAPKNETDVVKAKNESAFVNAKVRNETKISPKNATADDATVTTIASNATAANDTHVRLAPNTKEPEPIPDRVFEARKLSEQRNLFNMDTLPLTSSCPMSLSEKDINTTLVVQTSLERVWLLHETCSRWKDPIIAVVHVFNTTNSATNALLGNATRACPNLTILRYQADTTELDVGYPVNRLRNIGLDAVKTSHILVADVDFIPSINLHEMIQASLVSQLHLLGSREAIVVPAFERIPPEACDTIDCSEYLRQNSSFIPGSVDDLRACVTDKHCSVFQQSVNWEGHHSTRSESWLNGNWYDEVKDESTGETTRRIRHVKCFDSLRYEPYVVLRWCPIASKEDQPKPVAPYYDERFHGYGKNKIQLISHIRFMGYKFSILPKGFIVHNPHPESSAKQAWNNIKGNDLHETMDKLYPQYIKDVYNKYKDSTDYIVEQCDRGHKNKIQGQPKRAKAKEKTTEEA